MLLLALGVVGAPRAAPAILSNPSFELGPTGWSATSSGLILNVSGGLPVTPYDGSWAAWLGGDANTQDVLSQDVFIPGDMRLVSLQLQLWIETAETSAVEYDSLLVTLEEPGGEILETLADWSNVDATTGWTATSLPIAGDYTGQTVRLVFDADNDISSPTSFYLDALTLTIPEPTGGMPAGLLGVALLARRRRRERARPAA